ncbi:MAG TPA: tetraacyldisaccharide 4'-kinase [Bacteroidota bacterium]|nr:tetraacyldisaccharide 4'-kinase [Bacteroidota bacterium]
MSGRALLLPLSMLYGVVVTLRNWLFDIGVLPVRKVSVPVISVGNISAGGVGKTPLVEFLALRLKKKNKVAVISRGYGRKSKGYLVVSNGKQRCAEAWKAGDEASQLAEKMDGVVILVDEKRARAAEHAVKDFQAGVILLDDGFQHRYLHRDLNIVVLSFDSIIKGDSLLPAGNMRESMTSLKRADVIGISRCESKEQFEKARALLLGVVDRPMFGFRTQVKDIKTAYMNKKLQGKWKKAIAFSGIGTPSAFEETLKSKRIPVVRHMAFPDHHWYSRSDLEVIRHSFIDVEADAIVTTEKDVARLNGDTGQGQMFLKENPVYYVEIEPEMIVGEDMLQNKLKSFDYAHRNN